MKKNLLDGLMQFSVLKLIDTPLLNPIRELIESLIDIINKQNKEIKKLKLKIKKLQIKK